ncbi:hypothetical protein M231_01331 [Tremella mesenterica]|uniref:Uncharacterized protein n=1 Tax=Tremella mesenterica TaxID=5217 RepID=A0A4Q1BTR9_TREME|nr:hypothetical protein M231_01331 [Tremella mesenterica]
MSAPPEYTLPDESPPTYADDRDAASQGSIQELVRLNTLMQNKVRDSHGNPDSTLELQALLSGCIQTIKHAPEMESHLLSESKSDGPIQSWEHTARLVLQADELSLQCGGHVREAFFTSLWKTKSEAGGTSHTQTPDQSSIPTTLVNSVQELQRLQHLHQEISETMSRQPPEAADPELCELVSRFAQTVVQSPQVSQSLSAAFHLADLHGNALSGWQQTFRIISKAIFVARRKEQRAGSQSYNEVLTSLLRAHHSRLVGEVSAQQDLSENRSTSHESV